MPFNRTYLLILIVSIGAVFRFGWLGKDSYELDEGASLFISDRPIAQILEIEDEPNPPLFFTLLHFWLKISGNEEGLARWLPAFFSLLSLLVVFIFARELFGSAGGLMALLVVSLSPHQIFFAQELRGYSLLFLLTLSSSYFLWKMRTKDSRLLKTAYVLSAVLLLHTHIYGWFVFFFQVMWVIWQERPLKKWWPPLLTVILLFIPYLLWFIPTLIRVQGDFWLNRPGLIHLIGAGPFLLGSTPLFILYAAALGWGGGLLARRQPVKWYTDSRLQFIILWLAVTCLLPFLLSQIVTPFFMDRYLMTAVFPFIAFLIWLLAEILSRPARIIVLVFIVLFSGWEIYQDISQPAREPWRVLAQDLKDKIDSGDDILVAAGFCADNILTQYAGGLRSKMIELDREDLRSSDWKQKLGSQLSLSERNLWVVISRFHNGEEELFDFLTKQYKLKDDVKYFHRDVYGRWVSTIRLMHFKDRNKSIQE